MTKSNAHPPERPEYSVVVGADLQGDFCLYVLRNGNYLGAEKLERVAEMLETQLNSVEGR